MNQNRVESNDFPEHFLLRVPAFLSTFPLASRAGSGKFFPSTPELP
jgi:hypothetical protein